MQPTTELYSPVDGNRARVNAGSESEAHFRELGYTEHRPWSALTASEQAERLRDAIRKNDAEIRDLRQLVRALLSHTHGMRGELLGPIYEWGANAMSADCNYDPLA